MTKSNCKLTSNFDPHRVNNDFNMQVDYVDKQHDYVDMQLTYKCNMQPT